MKILKNQQLLIIIGAVVMIGGFGLLRYFPLARKHRLIKAERVDYHQGNELIKQQARQLPILNAKMDMTLKKVGKFSDNVPSSRKFALLCDEIAEVMKRHNLTEQLIEPSSEVVGEKITCIPISIQCVGELDEIFAFFKSIESFDRLIRVENLEMKKKTNEDLITMRASAKVYYRPDADGNEDNNS